jgi:hypothetical protein
MSHWDTEGPEITGSVIVLNLLESISGDALPLLALLLASMVSTYSGIE